MIKRENRRKIIFCVAQLSNDPELFPKWGIYMYIIGELGSVDYSNFEIKPP